MVTRFAVFRAVRAKKKLIISSVPVLSRFTIRRMHPLLQTAPVLALAPPVRVSFAEIPMSWYAMPDWWVAAGTVALAIITFFLALYTYKLFRATREARTDSLNALRIAEQNAQAAQQSAATARESMGRSLRAYVIVDELKVVNKLENILLPVGVTIVITNAGQVPACDTYIECHAGVVFLQTDDCPGRYENDESIKQMRGVIGRDQKRDLDFGFTEAFVRRHEPSLTFGRCQLQLRGSIKYLDVVANQQRQTDFNFVWHAQRGYFVPADSNGNAMI